MARGHRKTKISPRVKISSHCSSEINLLRSGLAGGGRGNQERVKHTGKKIEECIKGGLRFGKECEVVATVDTDDEAQTHIQKVYKMSFFYFFEGDMV